MHALIAFTISRIKPSGQKPSLRCMQHAHKHPLAVLFRLRTQLKVVSSLLDSCPTFPAALWFSSPPVDCSNLFFLLTVLSLATIPQYPLVKVRVFTCA